ncbi:MAG TPA: prephenate dehydratase [Conexibacter sp.]|jgi:prephenate dehydratase|nr:prephenate dehydratase [Conexibacter sp.]
MRIAYLGPAGTNSHEALLAATAGSANEHVSLPTIYDCVIAVQEGKADRAFVPIENALEGSVNATLDAIAVETDDVAIVGEHVHAIHTCLIARAPLELGAIETVVSHPQANAQCAHFLRTRLPQATVLAASSTAEAVRTVAEQDGPTAALGSRTAARLYGCEVLRADVDDAAGNETRFVWLAKRDPAHDPHGTPAAEHGPWKTAIVFWGVGAEAPGWLVRCLSEFAFRGVNLTRIESRPRKQGLGRYMFFIDIEGRAGEGPVAEALEALRAHAEHLRVLGSFPAA